VTTGTDDHAWQWDVFISYAREDYVTAKGIYDALQADVTESGIAPKVYLDISATGTLAGVDWQKFLEETLRNSRFFVAVYSQTYFKKDVCLWELDLANELKLGEDNRFVPVRIDQGPKEEVPYNMRKFNWVPTSKVNWMGEVRQALRLRAAAARPVLRFDTPVADVIAGHTLSTVTVTGSTPEGEPPWPPGGAITISSDPPASGLTGTLTRLAAPGTAVFSDLAFHETSRHVRLIAESPGCERAVTAPFAVTSPDEQPQPADDDSRRPSITARGRPVFFPDSQALAVRDGTTLTIYTAAHEPAGTAELREPARLWARGDRCLAAADWSGRVMLASPDGTVRVADLPAAHDGRLNVPGALAFDGDTLYAGMWSGAVWRLSIDAGPEQVLTHPAGVQVLLAANPGLVVGDLAGRLTRYPGFHPGDEPAASHQLEPLLFAITRVRDFALIIGEHRIHRLDLATGHLIQVGQLVDEVTGTEPGGNLTTIIGSGGQCVSFDAELAVRDGFHTAPGSRLAGSGGGGRLLVLEHPDGTHALVRSGRTTYISRHPLAVSPDGLQVAVSDGERLLTVSPGDLDGLTENGGQRDAVHNAVKEPPA
jgi:hypothetical protein